MFSVVDWSVIAVYLFGTTWLGHWLRGPQRSTFDFFLGGRSVPWQAVAASSIATTISAITFVSVPALVFASEGNFTYLQLAIAGILSRVIVAYYLVPYYFSGEFYSPYDFTRARLGASAGQLISLLFLLGGVLGQSVRVYATALVLELMTGWTLSTSVIIIALFSILWTWMGGIRTVIWTDVVQFFVLIGSALFVLCFIVLSVPTLTFETWQDPLIESKLTVFNFTTDPRVAFTFWAALIALPFQNVAVYGGDQLFVQRLLCCRDQSAARKAVLFSTLGELIPVIMLSVGLGLVLYYQTHPIPEAYLQLIEDKPDRIFPVFILSVMPEGLRGLIIAGLLSAAISSLDSILAALAQVSYGAIGDRIARIGSITLSRALVLVWGIVLAAMAVTYQTSELNLVDLAFTMTTYTYGPLFGLILLSIIGLREARSCFPAVGLSILIVVALNHPQLIGFSSAAPLLAWPWLFPIATLCTVGIALGLDQLKARSL